MNFKEKFILGSHCLKTVLFNRKIPIFITWSITERCNLNCKYCHAWQRESPELPMHQICEIITALSKMGTRMIRFTGGEPLLRDDIAEIINYASDLGISTSLSTNGTLFSKRIKEMRKLNRISVSIDGPEDIHDFIRGKDSHKKAMEALRVAKEKNIDMSISTTLNSFNLTSIEYLLGIAKEFNAKIFFQPATKIVLYGEEINPVSPDINHYRKVILSLIRSKKRNRFIGNSVTGLRHLYHWPYKKHINCIAGKIIYRLDCRGNINPCGRFILKDNKLNIIEKGIDYCFGLIHSPNCGYCWCSSLVELNLISKFSIDALANSVTI